MPDLAQYIQTESSNIARAWAQMIQTLNALSRIDTISTRPATPTLDHILFTASDTGITYIGIAGAWAVLTGFNGTTRTVTTTATASATDSVILADATGGAFTVNLPAASNRAGRVYTIKKTDASANAVTVDGNAAETIDGALTKVLATQYASTMIVCDGSNWFII